MLVLAGFDEARASSASGGKNEYMGQSLKHALLLLSVIDCADMRTVP